MTRRDMESQLLNVASSVKSVSLELAQIAEDSDNKRLLHLGGTLNVIEELVLRLSEDVLKVEQNATLCDGCESCGKLLTESQDVLIKALAQRHRMEDAAEKQAA